MKKVYKYGLLMAMAAGVSSLTSACTSTAEERPSLATMSDDDLFGDLEDGQTDSPWLEESYDSSNAIDRALSSSPYKEDAENGRTSKRKLKKASQKSSSSSSQSAGDWWSQ